MKGILMPPQKTKDRKYTLRFLILSAFIAFILIMIVVLRVVTFDRFFSSMITLSFNVMEQVSERGFTLIMNRMRNMSILDQKIAQLIHLDVISADNLNEIATYTTNLMSQNEGIYTTIESIYYADEKGNYVFSQKNNDKNILTEIFNAKNTPPTHTIFNYDFNGKLLNKRLSYYAMQYQPSKEPWYIIAKKSKKLTWLDVYPYPPNHLLGISVTTPVFDTHNVFIGAVSINVRLDYLRRLIETIYLSKNGLVFIVSTDGRLVVFPHLTQYTQKALIQVKNLKKYPWVQEAFLEYNQTKHKNFTFKFQGAIYLASFDTLYSFNNSEWLIAAVAPANDFIAETLAVHFNTMILSLFITLIGVIIMSSIITFITKPLKRISEEIEKIREFELDDETKPPISSIKEISLINNELDAMKKSLRSFQKYVPSTLVRQLIETGEVAHLGGSKKILAILFCDIEKFTSIAEHAVPDLLIQQVCQYFDELSNIITKNAGTIDKYMGDAIMAFWGAPMAVNNPVYAASIAALLCVQRVNQLNMQWKKENKPPFVTRVGLHLGETIVGNLGSSERLNYTAIGDTVNIASRLVGINKIYGTQIIVSETVYEKIKNIFILRMIDRITVKGRVESHYIYELLTENKSALSFDVDAYKKYFNQAFERYQRRNWSEAIELFQICLKIYPEDTVSIVFMNRIQHFKTHPPKVNWKGDWNISEK